MLAPRFKGLANGFELDTVSTLIMATLFKDQHKEADIVRIVSRGSSQLRQIGQDAPIEKLPVWEFTTAQEITISRVMGVRYSIENGRERFFITDISPMDRPAKTFIAFQI
jgi:hypothetical protein